MEGDRYKIIVRSSTESIAYDKALDDIKEYCNTKGVTYEVIEDKAEYQGIEKGAKAMIGTSDALSREMSDLPRSESLDRKDDNRVAITFRCKTAISPPEAAPLP